MRFNEFFSLFLEENDNRDTEYMNAVKSGDIKKQQAMVDDAAKASEYNIGPVFHGTQSVKRFSEFIGMWNYRFHAEKGTSYFTNDEDIASGYGGVRVISAYLKFNNPLEKDANGNHWTISSPSALVKARKDGNDGVILKNVLDTPAGKTDRPIDVYVTFKANQIKSSDPVTYDPKGDIIPLSQRFDKTKDSIFY
jgi:hypothetical protein